MDIKINVKEMVNMRKSNKIFKPTEKQFRDYLDIQGSGIVNMTSIKRVCEASETHITPDICLYIMNHYSELREEYGC